MTRTRPASAATPGEVAREGSLRGDLGRAVAGVFAGAIGLAIAAQLLPDLTISGLGDLLGTALLLGVVGFLLRPMLVWVASRLGLFGALVLALFGQAVVVYVAVLLAPGASFSSWWTAFWAGWIVAFVGTLVGWLLTAGTDQAVTVHLVRRARRRPAKVEDPELTGVVFVQLDGVAYPVLSWSVLGGTLPTLSRWIRSGRYRMVEWTPMLPATTPASQMGILHGTIEGIPAFRWVDRSTGQVFVANRPKDAAEIERLHSDGRGLLADGGIAVSNLFTGDAPTAYATMSALGSSQSAGESRRTLTWFLARPEGLPRGLGRTLTEVVRERFQALRQARQDIRPRVHRGWDFAGERAALNGVLRDFNTTLVAEAMLRGERSVYVNYVDYDAVAHHAGIVRPESLDALVGVDAVLGQLEKVAAVAPRPYRIIVLSDHGQSQGEVFADRYGEDLSTLVGRLADAEVTSAQDNTEGAGRVHAMIGGGAGDDTVLGRALRDASLRVSDRAHDEEDAAQEAVTAGTGGQEEDPERFLVFGSGNLGLVYVAGEDHRLTLDELTARFPALVPGLVAHEGVSFVVVQSAEHGPVVIGRDGEHRVRDGVVVGVDPLLAFGADAPGFVLRAASMPETPDIYVNSVFDPETGEVAAFEGLVGCHGGLGGWQDRAVLVWPEDLPEPGARIVGADAMHRQLVSWLEHLGHRRGLPPARQRLRDVRLPDPQSESGSGTDAGPATPQDG